MATTERTEAGVGLRRDAIGLREVLFQSITDMAPGAAIAASIPAGVLFAGYYGIRTSARLGTVLGVFEIGVFLVLAIFLVVHAGSNNTLSVFTTKYTTPGFHGISGVTAGSVFTILAFGGFEGAAPLAEEARNPRRTIQRAVMNVACIGYFARKRTGFNVLSHLIIPLLGVAAFVPDWLSAAGIPAFNFITPLTTPYSYMGPAVAVWMVIGLIYLIALYSGNKQRVTEVGLVHLDPLEEYPSE